MGVFIKGMEMPKNCADCKLIVYADGTYVCPFSGIMVLNIGRQDDCPLVEVKTPHGRLIDADNLLFEEGQMAVIQDASYGRGREGMKNAIRNALTVIESEE